MKLKMCRTQSVLALLALYVGLVQSWDVAVSYKDQLKFYTRETLMNTIRFDSQTLGALAYDDVGKRILYVDKHPSGDAICSYTLTSVENRCLTERTGRNIHGIAYDSSTETIFFTDTNDRTVNTFSLKPESQNSARGNLLISIDQGIPRDIIVDSCKRHVYWITTNKPQPTIERARFTGTEREVFRTLRSVYVNPTCQVEPHSLTIDPRTQKIYWYEPWNTTGTRIYSSSELDMQRNSYVLEMPLSFPVCIHPSNTLAVTENFFFLVDYRFIGANMYIFRKENLLTQHPIPFYKKINDTPQSSVHNSFEHKPAGIVANYQMSEQDQDCEIF